MTWDAIVIGAGPAGSAAAIRLAESGARVGLLEKERFPRRKVCGEFLSGRGLAAAESLGARERIEQSVPERIARGAIVLARGREIPFSLPSPAIGISRYRLDALLADRASEAGAEIVSGARVVSIAGDPASGFIVRLADAGGERTEEARAVIGAWGRWDALDLRFDRSFVRRSRFFGWSADFAGDAREFAGTVRLYLFPGGYCGLSRVEGGVLHLAGIVSERVRRRLGPGWEAVLDHARRSNVALDRDLGARAPDAASLKGTVPIIFAAKPPSERGILLAGDAAGVIDPFSGEGQAGALAAGSLAGDTAARFLRGELSARAYVPAYEAAWRRAFRRRLAVSAGFRRLILHPRLGALLGRIAGDRIARIGLAALGGAGAAR